MKTLSTLTALGLLIPTAAQASDPIQIRAKDGMPSACTLELTYNDGDVGESFSCTVTGDDATTNRDYRCDLPDNAIRHINDGDSYMAIEVTPDTLWACYVAGGVKIMEVHGDGNNNNFRHSTFIGQTINLAPPHEFDELEYQVVTYCAEDYFHDWEYAGAWVEWGRFNMAGAGGDHPGGRLLRAIVLGTDRAEDFSWGSECRSTHGWDEWLTLSITTDAPAGSGTDHPVDAQLVLNDGSVTDWERLDHAGDDFEEGVTDVYQLLYPEERFANGQTISALRLKISGVDDWRPTSAELHDGFTGNRRAANALDGSLVLDVGCGQDAADGCGSVVTLGAQGTLQRLFELNLITSYVTGADSDADLEARLVLTDGSSTPWIELNLPGDDFEMGDNDVYALAVDADRFAGGVGVAGVHIRNNGTDTWNPGALELSAPETVGWVMSNNPLGSITLDGSCDADLDDFCAPGVLFTAAGTVIEPDWVFTLGVDTLDDAASGAGAIDPIEARLLLSDGSTTDWERLDGPMSAGESADHAWSLAVRLVDGLSVEALHLRGAGTGADWWTPSQITFGVTGEAAVDWDITQGEIKLSGTCSTQPSNCYTEVAIDMNGNQFVPAGEQITSDTPVRIRTAFRGFWVAPNGGDYQGLVQHGSGPTLLPDDLRFTLVDELGQSQSCFMDGDVVAIRSNTGRYVLAVDNDLADWNGFAGGSVMTRLTSVGGWEKFVLEHDGGGCLTEDDIVTFRSNTHGTYVTLEVGDSLTATSATPGNWSPYTLDNIF